MELSIEECRRWCRAHTERGQGKHMGFDKVARELPTGGFLRAIGLDWRLFYNWLNGKERLPAAYHAIIARFIAEWEAGHLEFEHAPRGKRVLVRRDKPRPRGARLTVEIGPHGARTAFIARPKLERMPAFPDISGALKIDKP